ncbi:SAM-dependent methyltransferase [Actinomadura sp. ATCC 31491]|uniref:SAM-dependent methyltransferase n=1 Tax=Actinomadura luzonensis TaxID=2805427 RepID=A0ABT0FM76_9ACTN|nr:SAM-dependent methyltransferase [Actinomadura luzonensis]MCK2213446.1 SAM-dependent methyltransferase [Actinomadura luzonensis]
MSHGERERAPGGIDVTRPSVSRVYDALLGGTENAEADRRMLAQVLLVAPDAHEAAWTNRMFLRRVVRYLAGQCGVRQFLDIGSGLPTQGNVHEIAQATDPRSRVVYVDHDPLVLVHGQALLASDASTVVVEADLRRPVEILTHPQVRRLIDFDWPVGLLLFGILHHLTDDEDPAGIVSELVEALPSGSYVAVSHFFDPGPAAPDVSRQVATAELLFNRHRWRPHRPALSPRLGTAHETLIGGVACKL